MSQRDRRQWPGTAATDATVGTASNAPAGTASTAGAPGTVASTDGGGFGSLTSPAAITAANMAPSLTCPGPPCAPDGQVTISAPEPASQPEDADNSPAAGADGGQDHPERAATVSSLAETASIFLANRLSKIPAHGRCNECVHRLHHRFSRIPAHRPLQSFNRLQSHTRRDVRSQAPYAAATPTSAPVPTSSAAPPTPAQVSTTSHPALLHTHTQTTAAPLAHSLDLSETKQDVSLSPLV